MGHMKRTCVFLLFLLLLSGCGSRNRTEIESFAGETVATVINTQQIPAATEMDEPKVELTDEPKVEELVTAEIEKATEVIKTQPVESIASPSVSQATSTRPISNPPTQDGYPVETQPISPTATPVASETPGAPTETPSPTATTTTVPLEWEGEWQIWYQNTKGLYVHSILTLQRNNQTVTGSATIEGVEYRFAGTIYEQNQVVGEYYKNEWPVSFHWFPRSQTQFAGAWADRFGFCGNKTEAVQPENCRYLPPR